MNADNIGFYNNSYWGAYISASGDFFLSGSGNSGLSWDGSDLSVDGTIVARDGSIGGIELDADKMYIGTGTYNNANTAFFVSSSGKFSLKDKLVWDGSNLAIAGSITISNPGDIDISTLNNDSGFTDDSAANAAQSTANAATGSAAAAQTTANQATGSAASAQATANQATASAAAAQAGVNTLNSVTSSLANPTSYAFGAGSGAFDLATATAAAGLNLTSQYLGYHDGSNFKSYMDSDGRFYLTGDGDDALSWDGSNLRIGNRGVGPTITYQFSGSLDANIFDFSISNTTTYTSPVLGVLLQNNNDTWDEGFHTKAVFDRNDGPTFEWDIVVGHHTPATMIGLFKENPSSYHHNQQHHTVYFQSRDITIRENGTQIHTVANDDWESDYDFSENQQYRVKITLLQTGARYEIFKDGDFTSPAYVTSSAANGVTNQYVRPGASIHYDNSTSSHGLIFRAMAAGAQLGAATKISGNTIQTGKILSSNHAGTSDGSNFATTGMSIDLDGGAISAKNFRINSAGSAFFKGDVEASAGTIGGYTINSSALTDTGTGIGLIGGAQENLDVYSQGNVTSNADVYLYGLHIDKNNYWGFHAVDSFDTPGVSTTGAMRAGTDSSYMFYNSTAGQVGIKTPHLTLVGTNSGTTFNLGNKLTWNGTTLAIEGNITVTNTISADKVRTGDIRSQNHSGTADGSGFSTAGTSFDLDGGGISTPNFSIAGNGNAYFGGLITATAGITGSTIQGATMNAGTLTGAEIVGGALFIPDSSNPTFKVDAQGIMTASDASISGTITATDGQIGDWVIDPVTNALRDNDSEVIFSPDPAEIQMFSGGEKKVIIAPTADLTSTAGGTTSVSTTTITTLTSVTSNNSIQATTSNKYSALTGGTFTPSSAGDYEVTINSPTFRVAHPSGNNTVTVSPPLYDASSNGQTHGLFTTHRRKRHTVNMYLEAVRTSDNTVIGSVNIGSSSSEVGRSAHTYFVASGSQSTTGGGGGGGGLQSPSSVHGNTKIELLNGTTKLAKDITKNDVIKVWNWFEQGEYGAGVIEEVRTRKEKIYLKVETTTKTIKVSDNHGFWDDNNEKLIATDLIAGESQIYVKDGDGIKRELVTKVTPVYEDVDVYTFVIPGYQNYISNDIISHNPTTTVYTWVQQTASAISTTSNAAATHTGTANETFVLNISQATPFKFRYRVEARATSGYNISVSSLGTNSYTDTHTTLSSFGSAPSVDTSVEVAVPANFVEIKAGGIQVVSEPEKYVKIPRLNTGVSGTIFEARGGISITDALRPRTNGVYNLGGSSYRWNNVFSEAGNFSSSVSTGNLTVSGTITATGNITAFYSSDKRLKENIINLDGSLAKVLKLRGTRFDWKEGNKEIHPHSGNDIGFIAQEVKEILPEVVGQMHGGYYGVKYEKLTPILVEAIKELSKKVDELEKKLESKS